MINFTSSPRTIIGEGAFEASLPYISQLGKKALIVTGKVITKTGLTQKIQESLKSAQIDSVVFNDLPGEPSDLMIYAGVKIFREEKCDFIIGLGGGTPLDTAKAISAMSTLPGKLSDYKGKEMSGDFAPLALIPTTAGTGSEATKYLVYTDTESDSKLLLKGDGLLPKIAIIDHTYTVSSPASITLATGMDALTHAIESYTCKKATPISDLYCIDAIQRIFKYLPQAVRDGSDLMARKEMALAAYEAGVAINTSPTTIVHGMSRPIGALFHVPHGISNAMLLVECLRFVLDGCYNRFAQLAFAIGAANRESDDHEKAAKKFLCALENFTKELKIPSLREYGIDLERFKLMEEKMAKDSLDSGSPGNCHKKVTIEDQIKIYEILRSV